MAVLACRFVGFRERISKSEEEGLATETAKEVPEPPSVEAAKETTEPELIEKVPSDWKTFTSKMFRFAIQHPPDADLFYSDAGDRHIRSDEDIADVLNNASLQKFGKKFDLSDPKAIELLNKVFGPADNGFDSILFGVGITTPKADPATETKLYAGIEMIILWDEMKPSPKEGINMAIQKFQGSKTRRILSQQWVNINQIEGFEEIYWGWPEGKYWYPKEKSLWYILYLADKAHPGIYYIVTFRIFPSGSLETALNAYKICKQVVNTFRFAD